MARGIVTRMVQQYLRSVSHLGWFWDVLRIISDAKHGGWIFRLRVDTDGDLMIRVNEVTNLPDMGDVVWRLPDREDWPTV